MEVVKLDSDDSDDSDIENVEFDAWEGSVGS